MSRVPLYALAAAVSLTAAVLITVDTDPPFFPADVLPSPQLSYEPAPGVPPPRLMGVWLPTADTSAMDDLDDELTELVAHQEASATTTTTRARANTSGGGGTTTTTEAPAEESEPAGYFDSAAEADFARRINSFRSSKGKKALSRNGSLDTYARDWARHMAEEGSLSHSNLASLMPPWTSVGENVGQGSSVSQIWNLLVGSSGHTSNMLGDYTHMGIGVWRAPDGTLWTAHVFAHS